MMRCCRKLQEGFFLYLRESSGTCTLKLLEKARKMWEIIQDTEVKKPGKERQRGYSFDSGRESLTVHGILPQSECAVPDRNSQGGLQTR